MPPFHLVAFMTAMAVVVLTTPIVNAVARHYGIVDLPGDPRKLHQRPMVRLGGVSIFLSCLAALLLVWVLGGFGVMSQPNEYEIWGVTIGGLLFFLIGLADDLISLSAFTRLVLECGVAAMAWAVGVRIDFLTVPFMGLVQIGWLSLPVTVLWLVGITNAINMIDGLDGLAAGVSGIAAVVMLVVSLFMDQPGAALIAAALAGGCLGFLRYNFSPAKIFMGDGGAYYLGFTLAGVGVIGLVKAVTTVAVLLPYLILAVPILDVATVIVDRLRRGKSPFKADNRHLHHRLLQAGLSHRLIVLLIYALTLWVGSLALAISYFPAGGTYAAVATLLLGYIAWEAWKKAHSP
ncbi:glycosyltransferase family 4 protein [Leptolyngbya sp. FACHB-261]|uniref:glycosyltransferase family 4 protein n=1 Tax=Leptolyngbya sp. FACHB-261 TaxID=2692806 RepID=UPI001682F5C6|nr:MraY family glycosyltransferase [Leptolyngbya sp. FACHB-261]MBD2105090.1 undecaprenyl/decaprenyl-phosphate alpha-N-acetylglucosaminyl 1-phosphate transferase [Leptolyngbya sp. FACHB-261]